MLGPLVFQQFIFQRVLFVTPLAIVHLGRGVIGRLVGRNAVHDDRLSVNEETNNSQTRDILCYGVSLNFFYSDDPS